MTDNAIKQLGERLKGLRDVLELTLEEIAETAGITPEALQEMEAGNLDVSVSTLQKISRKYGIALEVLMFGEEPKMSNYFLTRSDCGVSIERTKAYKYQALASGFRGNQMNPFIVTVAPAETDQPLALNSHPGEEFNLVLEGEMELTIGGKAHVLNTGDSMYFNSELPHGMRALNGKSVKFLSVII